MEKESLVKSLEEIFGNKIDLDTGLFVSIENLANYFIGIEELTYNELMKIENENNYGYAEYILQWKEKGLIE